MQARLDRLEAELLAQAAPGRADKERAYLKSSLRHLGVPVPQLRKTARALAKEGQPLRPLAQAMWEREVHELRMLAVLSITQHAKRDALSREDLPWLEALLWECRTWALLDELAIKGVGPIVASDPDCGETLDRWARDLDFWIRRSALLVLLVPLRTGAGDFDRFVRYADAMLEEKEFFIRKAIGWVLREAGKKAPARVDLFLRSRTHRASGVTMREAVKPLPALRQESLMDAYRRKVPEAAPRPA
ncbi:MAG: DNA alkylation repair protein [Sandaracinaceae bacterium]